MIAFIISLVLSSIFQLTLQLTIYCTLWCIFEYWALLRTCVTLCLFYLFFSVLFHFILELNRVLFKKSMTSRNSKNTLKPSPMSWLCLPRIVSTFYNYWQIYIFQGSIKFFIILELHTTHQSNSYKHLYTHRYVQSN